MANLSRLGTAGAQAAVPTGSGSRPLELAGFQFDPLFIPRLKAEHRALLASYGKIKDLAGRGDWLAAEAELSQFRAMLTEHLVVESVRLYVYLTQSCAADAQKLATMRRFSAEMQGIGKAVIRFLEDHTKVVDHPAIQQSFVAGWSEIGRILGDRIRREESDLYPMYEAAVPR